MPEYPYQHEPVLHSTRGGEGSPVLHILRPAEGEAVLDATLGLGGHAEAFLAAVGMDGRLVGIDTDGENLARASERLRSWNGQCTFVQANFRDIGSLGIGTFDVIFADLGVSSPHLDDPSRGFTFREEAQLDLRFDRTHGHPASTLLATVSEKRLAFIFRSFGELPDAKRLAAELYAMQRRGKEAFATTGSLRRAIEKRYGYRAPTVLPRIFQALRIWVNDELAALDAFLESAPLLLRDGGRLGIISYHSLEDRRVKTVFRTLCLSKKDLNTGALLSPSAFELLTRKPVVPSPEEIARNPRARSAKFRAIRKRCAHTD